MVSLGQLWLPILLAPVLVFVASSVMHMALKYHNTDYRGLANEDAVRAAINAGGADAGTYLIPYTADMKEMGTPEMQRKLAEGPVGMLTLRKAGAVGMGASLVQWFVNGLVISLLTAYVAIHALPAGTHYLRVFQVVGTVAWLGYAGGRAQDSIWMGRPWGITVKDIADGLVYALLTAGCFGWLWPR